MPNARTHHQDGSPYHATPELERQLKEDREAILVGGEYVARVTTWGRDPGLFVSFCAWTESQPWAYGENAPTLEEALDSLEAKYRALVGPVPPTGR